jgi:hypothetical protein
MKIISSSKLAFDAIRDALQAGRQARAEAEQRIYELERQIKEKPDARLVAAHKTLVDALEAQNKWQRRAQRMEKAVDMFGDGETVEFTPEDIDFLTTPFFD